ncbi:MAG TPA: hypothetical protein VGO93_00750 [Candidatus Xenobia bacterium]
MTDQNLLSRAYTISIRPASDAGDGYHVVYTPRSLQRAGDHDLLHALENGGAPRQAIGPFEAVVTVQGGDTTVRWTTPLGDLAPAQNQFEQDAKDRVRLLSEWLDRLSALVNDVESWAKNLGWSTRRIEKPMEDSQIGKYKAPGLLMQEGTNRVLLEPIARSAPGTEGVVDLYLMPAYDDIATLSYEDGRWALHYLFPGIAATNPHEARAMPLSQETLQEVLTEMRQHAA